MARQCRRMAGAHRGRSGLRGSGPNWSSAKQEEEKTHPLDVKSMSATGMFRQILRLEQLATKRVLLGTNLGHLALIHTPPSRSSNVILWRRSARGAYLLLLAVLGCPQTRAHQT